MQAKKIKFNDAISETLFINLYFRALDNDEPDPILGDPFSRPVMQRIDYDFAKFKGGKFSKTGTVIRARFFDDEILDFARKNAGEKLVVVQVGAGLDTRPLRLEKQLPDVLFYDLDLPDVIDLRGELVPKSALNFSLKASMFETAWMDELRARHEGAKFIFVLEGVAMYFSEPEISTFMRNLAQRFSGVVMLDLLSRFAASIEPKKHDVLRYIANPPKFKLGIDDERSLEAWDERIKLLKTGVMMDIRPEKWCLAAKIFRIFSKIKNSCKMCVYGLNLS